ncbi:hypothetical protein N3114_10200 [Aliarcobacter butzleri]|uniref:hypothetical protein n=1 Tax=Aliarcobacter butzleri TaxID=28197 RepID=UPI0021B47F16|nr:hypothetical protein [Aliarcobacter butzleri]UXC29013.1 hypothetical protein N3114_10200 [Aliarcobacter butzleri]
MYTYELQKANMQAQNHKRNTTGLREIAGRISSCITTGDFSQQILIDQKDKEKLDLFLKKSK